MRLQTIFGTVLYVDEASGELRHGAIGGSPPNAVFAEDRGGRGNLLGRLMHDRLGSTTPILCSPERSWSSAIARRAASPLPPTVFERETPDAGLIALRADGLYLCAEIDGRITHSRRECGPWERFRPLDPALGPAEPESALGAVATRYHLGCGPHLIAGYLNIDRVADIQAGQVFADFGGVKGAYFVNHDLATGIPGCDNSLDIIYHCHFLEHLPYLDGVNLLRQARLRLKPGGLMRVVVPDLALWIENYHADNTAFFAEYRQAALGENALLYPTKGAVFTGMLYNFGHRCGYDFETMKLLLREIGFVNISRTEYRVSRLPDILTIEPDWRLRAMESLCIDCEKPGAGA